ncbi:MAG: amidohydrolase [Candidatus Dormibacteraeota bacterium]|uniref:Amidohydrolase n=2 Tax=Candidatus Nephthysia bennettiae TaxID=3127016 RepID=A0A934NEG3_9BACT|nr:amidohydrolase [Candidatus Dormibacteraeota bacterium]MBJ7614045.1 amidohydrolase [Candidatus Dormibacteraeota bacterium]
MEMDGAGVDRCVIVPLVPPGDDATASNPAAVAMAQTDPGRFAVMAPFDLRRPEKVPLLARWRETPGLLGVRLAFLRGPNLALLLDGRLDWFWSAAEEAGVPVMLLAPDLAAEVGHVAGRHPRLRLVLDHLNLHPMKDYDDLGAAVRPLLALAAHDNVATKASALPCWARDSFPYRSVRQPLESVVEAFGTRRVFWGSDLTRLPCSYSECVRLFTEEMPFLDQDDLEWVMGRGVMEWLGWDANPGLRSRDDPTLHSKS